MRSISIDVTISMAGCLCVDSIVLILTIGGRASRQAGQSEGDKGEAIQHTVVLDPVARRRGRAALTFVAVTDDASVAGRANRTVSVLGGCSVSPPARVCSAPLARGGLGG